ELELYGLAFNGGALLPFKDLPHMAAMFTLRDEDGLRDLLGALQAEIDRRRELFAEAGVDNAEHYRQKTGAQLTSIVVVIDGFDVLYCEAQLADYNSVLGEFKDRIEGLLRAGCDIHLVLTTVTATLFRDGIEKNVTGRIALQLQDRADYYGVLGAPPPFLIDEARGRALWREGAEMFELQMAAPTTAATSAEETEMLAATALAMAAASGGYWRETAFDRWRARGDRADGSITEPAVDTDALGARLNARLAQNSGARRGGAASFGLPTTAVPYTPLEVPDLTALAADDLSWLPPGVERIEFQTDAEAPPVAIDLDLLRRTGTQPTAAGE
ncbi:MAG TPA: FtsK/SpoIIIE domain-containing protein, partial [Anaerolineales bacterium]|nr:FtsK/SpoIIIE domain-containing protein [Anaerolineales bacterium]